MSTVALPASLLLLLFVYYHLSRFTSVWDETSAGFERLLNERNKFQLHPLLSCNQRLCLFRKLTFIQIMHSWWFHAKKHMTKMGLSITLSALTYDCFYRNWIFWATGSGRVRGKHGTLRKDLQTVAWAKGDAKRVWISQLSRLPQTPLDYGLGWLPRRVGRAVKRNWTIGGKVTSLSKSILHTMWDFWVVKPSNRLQSTKPSKIRITGDGK